MKVALGFSVTLCPMLSAPCEFFMEASRGRKTEIELGVTGGIGLNAFIVYLRSFGRKIWGRPMQTYPGSIAPMALDFPQSFLARPFQPKKCQSKVKINLFFSHLIHKIKGLSWSDPVRIGFFQSHNGY